MPQPTLPIIQIYHSKTQKKIELKTLRPGIVTLYACGMTVYDYCHAGHARVMIVFDMVKRYLEHRGYQVIYARNITDIDDKIIARAHKNNQTCEALTQEFIQAMHEDCQALGVLPPTHEPKATEYIHKMIAFIQTLIKKNAAYLTQSGDVCFRIASFQTYGALSNRNVDDMRSGARVSIQKDKEDPLDFILWKKTKDNEPSWPSPWGNGRPGWHIECSTMSTDLLGHEIDIHGGGVDLKFPHHENEIAQSESAYNTTFAHHWMHVGHIQVNKEKMSKSLGNFFTIRDVLKQYHPEVIRYFMLMRHYRSPLEYSADLLEEAKHIVTRWYQMFRGLNSADHTNAVLQTWPETDSFYKAMDDDFNTPLALSVLTQMMHQVNRHQANNEYKKANQLAAHIRQLAEPLGLLGADPDLFFKHHSDNIDPKWIETQIQKRNTARATKDYAAADKIRDELLKKGIELEDNPKGTEWKRL
jgi:cysteinyl-tRNA synthetase